MPDERRALALVDGLALLAGLSTEASAHYPRSQWSLLLGLHRIG